LNRDDLIRALRKYCRRRDLPFLVDAKRGNGSHYLVSVGDKRTTVQSYLDPHKIRTILKQLGVDPADL
jgi:hypothetical protein